MTEQIQNMAVYLDGMQKSMLDKIFFMDKIDADLVVDFGCGDGTMLDFMAGIFPETRFIGFDENPDMVYAANEKNRRNPNVYISDSETGNASLDMERFFGLIKNMTTCNKKAIVLSSVLHEVHSYKTPQEINQFYSYLFTVGFDYIIIRDMAFTKELRSTTMFEERMETMTNVGRIMRNGDVNQIKDFENVSRDTGFEREANLSLDNIQDQYEYLLKYRYTENWEREKNEEYFSATNKILNMAGGEVVKDYGYVNIYEERFTPFFIKQSVKEKFDVNMVHNTHIKLILKKV